MKREIIHILRCPHCSDPDKSLILQTTRESNGRIMEGTLNCPSCDARFPVLKGIPRLLISNPGLEQELDGNREFWEKFKYWI